MATNINYPAVNLPCPLLSGNTYQPGTTFIRSEFDYAIRQRKQYCAQYSVGFSFVIKSQLQMEIFKDFFYNTLNYGVNSFLADWEIEGMDGIKEFRFSSVYSTVSLGASKYRITASFDMLTKIKDLFVIPSIQYNMDVISTEIDGTRYIKNDGKGGSSFNAEAFASDHIYLNGTTQSVPYPVLHNLGSNEITGLSWSLVSGDETSALTDNTASTFTLAVTVVGTNAYRPYIRINSTANSSTKSYKISFTATVTSGTSVIKRLYNGVNYDSNYTVTDGYNEIVLVNIGDDAYGSLIVYFDGTQLFDVSATNFLVEEITLPTASYLSRFGSTTNTIIELSSTGDRGDTLPIGTTYSVTDSHQFALNHTAPLEDIDISALEADPNLAFRMFLDGEVLPSGFSNTDVGWFSGGNEGLASAEKVYDLSDQAFLTYVSIVDYDAATRTTLANQSNGASNLKLTRNVSGGTTGIAAANTTQWEADGRTAVTNWTITAPFTITEEIDGDTYDFTSDGNRYKNSVVDGTYPLPTGVWTLDEFGFDGVTSVTARGVTKKINEIVVP